MTLTVMKIFTLGAILISIVKCQKSIRRCDRNYCKNPSTLIEPDEQKINIEMTRTRFAMRAAPKTAEILYVKRNWLTIYCYDGTSIDSNTGCYEKTISMLPTCKEIREWNKNGHCKTGKECAPDGDCWGSGSTICTNRNPVMTNNIGPTNIKWAGERWMLFPHHTCVSSWECLLIKAEVDIFAEISNGKEYFYYMDNNNKKHIYTQRLYVEGDENNLGRNIQCLKDEIGSYVSEMVEATCFGESKDKVKCVLISGDEWDGVVIDVQEGEVSILRNAIFHLKGPLYVPDGRGKIINIGKTENRNSYKNGLSKVYELTRSASIEDVLELSYSLAAAQMQTIFNLLKLSERTANIEKTLIQTIKSLSMLDPGILNKITGGDPYIIHWQTPDIFETCPCYDVGEFENSNCNSEYMYKEGTYVYKNDTSMCKYYHKEEVKNVSLFKNLSLETTLVNILPPQTSSVDSSTWDSLMDWRNDKIEGDHTSHSYSNLEDKIEELYDKLGIRNIEKWFWIATAFIAWLSGLFVVGTAFCNFRKQ